jgi:hypothetical protein
MTAEKDAILSDLRRLRDWYAGHGMVDHAMILDDRIRDLVEGRTSVMVERVMKRFESAAARYDAEKTKIN